jgi:hypothetical protein
MVDTAAQATSLVALVTSQCSQPPQPNKSLLSSTTGTKAALSLLQP